MEAACASTSARWIYRGGILRIRVRGGNDLATVRGFSDCAHGTVSNLICSACVTAPRQNNVRVEKEPERPTTSTPADKAPPHFGPYSGSRDLATHHANVCVLFTTHSNSDYICEVRVVVQASISWCRMAEKRRLRPGTSPTSWTAEFVYNFSRPKFGDGGWGCGDLSTVLTSGERDVNLSRLKAWFSGFIENRRRPQSSLRGSASVKVEKIKDAPPSCITSFTPYYSRGNGWLSQPFYSNFGYRFGSSAMQFATTVNAPTQASRQAQQSSAQTITYGFVR